MDGWSVRAAIAATAMVTLLMFFAVGYRSQEMRWWIRW